jgi:hypothetical protein
MQSALQSQGVFFLFGGFSLCASVFVYFFIKETKYLTDREKKSLYSTQGFEETTPLLRRGSVGLEVPALPSDTHEVLAKMPSTAG